MTTPAGGKTLARYTFKRRFIIMMTFVFWGVLIVGGVLAFVLEEHRQDIKDAEETINILMNKYGMTHDEAIAAFNRYNGEI